MRQQQDRLVFAFVGKSGVEHRVEIDDAVVIAAIEVMRRRRGGDDLSCWPTRTAAAGARCCPTRSTTTSATSTGLDATAKDFRTWHATVLAAAALAETPEPGETKASRKRAVAGRDEGGRVVPRQHPDARPLVVRRPAGIDAYEEGRTIERGHPAQLRHARRATGRAGACDAAAVEGELMEITAVQGDITEQEVDAVVNAANKRCAAAVVSTARSTGRRPRGARGLRRRFPTGWPPATPAGPPPATARALGDPRRRPQLHAGERDRSLLLSCYSPGAGGRRRAGRARSRSRWSPPGSTAGRRTTRSRRALEVFRAAATSGRRGADRRVRRRDVRADPGAAGRLT